KLCLGLLDNSPPHQTRVFGDIDGKLIDLRLAYATLLIETGEKESAYEVAAFYFPPTVRAFLERGEKSLKALEDVLSLVSQNGAQNFRGAAGEKVAYSPNEIRILPPLPDPGKSIVVGFADRVRVEAIPRTEIPTGFYKLPQTFVTSGAPIVWPKFSQEVDADACFAIVIGKAGKRIAAEETWQHVAGATLVIDITARDVNRREGATTNNLLGKNFPSSTSLGPAVLLTRSRKELESLAATLSLDGITKQRFALRDAVFSIEQIIARWSILGIKPGDWLAIGASMSLESNRLQNPVPLRLGSAIRCSSSAIGELSHQVVSS
ncbi:MAG TPA: fumarylacetoacetate hydrolase family protein, partial [Candidatus Acidoferrales bacterium]|nr:fumarylacetoacetate hydrolase family protein [Candidatus Acidoferrales bacterium]